MCIRDRVDPDEAHERFNHELDKLQFESQRLAEIQRTPENFDKLAAGHERVNEIQKRATAAKRDIRTRYEGKGSDFIDSHPGGPGDTSRAGKVGVFFGIVLLLAGTVGAVFVFLSWSRTPVAVLDVVGETTGIQTRGNIELCVWSFDVVIENTGPSTVQVDGASIIVERQPRGAIRSPGQAPEIEPSQQMALPLVFSLGPIEAPEHNGTCPAAEALDHGPIRVDTTDGRAIAEF